MFNRGYMCQKCGASKDANTKTSKGFTRYFCKSCESIVTPWERPLNERAGRCSNCGNGSFKQAIKNGNFLTCCKKCEQVVNIDTNKILRAGKI